MYGLSDRDVRSIPWQPSTGCTDVNIAVHIMVSLLFMRHVAIPSKNKIAATAPLPAAISNKFLINNQSRKIAVMTRCV